MGRLLATILLVLSLAAIAAASRPAMSGDVDTIRLPSDGKGVVEHNQATPAAAEAARSKGGDQQRPWKCCNEPICPSLVPAFCICPDNVQRCGDACKHCKDIGDDYPGFYVCGDLWPGTDPGPTCWSIES